MLRVLVVGQTPPPYHGQAISTQRLLKGEYSTMRLHHVRMEFSADMSEVGRFKVKKLWHLAVVVARIVWAKLRFRPDVLYYMPAGPQRNPVIRDLVILLSTRWMFRKTIFHFRAGGVSTMYDTLPRLFRIPFRKAYFDADLAIQLSDFNPPDGERLHARRTSIVPNGIEDHFPDIGKSEKSESAIPCLLFVGALREDKGVMVLLDAVRRLRDTHMSLTATFVGEFRSPEFQSEFWQFVDEHKLGEHIECTGRLTGDDLWRAYAESDIFCFPSFYENETFGNVVVEAMQFQLPVVATRWRGIQSIVEDGRTGYLVPACDSVALSEKIATLMANPDLRRSMGERGRQVFLEHFTVDTFRRNMEAAITSVA